MSKLTETQFVATARSWTKKRYTFRVAEEVMAILTGLCSRNSELSQADVVAYAINRLGTEPIDAEVKKEFLTILRGAETEKLAVRLEENIGDLITKLAKNNKMAQTNIVGFALYDLFKNGIEWRRA